jgi:ATP-dependent Lhr-like helicase
VAAHHGSLAKELRLDAEQRLKRGELQVLIATASLELGIDIGEVDLVCQIASPRSIGFLQRVGRSGHQVGGTPKGRLFATTRDDLIECAALLDCVRRGELDTLHIPEAAGRAGPADHRRSQLPGMAGRRAAGAVPPPRPTPRSTKNTTRRCCACSPRATTVARASAAPTCTATRSAAPARPPWRQLTAVTSGGTIPDNADYSVLLEPQGLNIGSVNEDFAVESIAGDVFQLGNTSYRILRVEPARCGSRMPRASRRPFRSGSAKRRGAATSCRRGGAPASATRRAARRHAGDLQPASTG